MTACVWCQKKDKHNTGLSEILSIYSNNNKSELFREERRWLTSTKQTRRLRRLKVTTVPLQRIVYSHQVLIQNEGWEKPLTPLQNNKKKTTCTDRFLFGLSPFCNEHNSVVSFWLGKGNCACVVPIKHPSIWAEASWTDEAAKLNSNGEKTSDWTAAARRRSE